MIRPVPAAIVCAAIACAALGLAAASAMAGPVVQVADPAALAARLSGVQDFEALPLYPEPGVAVDAPIVSAGLTIGERLVGQRLEGHLHDRLSGHPRPPLALAPARAGTFLATAFHPGFGSNALFPVGPAGAGAIEGRGEGAVALLFDRDTSAVTLKLHAGYGDPLGTQPPPGHARFAFYDRDGTLLDRLEIALASGPVTLGFLPAPGARAIAAITLTNDDPGGIALDDIRFARAFPGS